MAHPSYYIMGKLSFPGIKRTGLGVDHPPSSSTEVKERKELTLHPLRVFVACFRVKFTFNVFRRDMHVFQYSK
jgi:hypothetical protein